MKSASRVGAGCRSKARWAALVVLTCATLLLGTAAAAFTGGHGGGSHGGYGHGDHGHHGGFHGRTFIGPVWFGWPYYYYPYAYAYPGEYAQPDLSTPLAPDAYWYYCAPAGAYYPDVRYCPAPWITVPPQSPTG